MFLMHILGKLIGILRSGPSPAQVAFGFSFGMILGMMPFFNLMSAAIIVVVFLIDVNISAALLGWMVFKLFAYAFDPLFHDIGYKLLAEAQFMSGFWAALYNLPLVPLTRFNNTVVLGSFVLSAVLFFPVFTAMRAGIIQYRERLEPKVRRLKLVRFFQSNRVYDYYQRLRNLGD
ncbi:TIGR03546 family protein [candidate division KSB1 bacterium]